jgi:hypothetical protein
MFHLILNWFMKEKIKAKQCLIKFTSNLIKKSELNKDSHSNWMLKILMFIGIQKKVIIFIFSPNWHGFFQNYFFQLFKFIIIFIQLIN